jgi:glycosyltransferase involved in cell wall biosynthesis
MRVLWVYKVFDVGGAEQLLLELLPHLQSHVQVIPVAMNGSTGAMAERYRSAGLSPVDLQASSSFDVSWAVRFGRLVRRLRPDLVHFHSPLPAAIGRPILAVRGVPIVYTEHNAWANYVWPTRWANIVTYPLNSASIAVSGWVRASQEGSRLGRVAWETRVIHNGIDVGSVRRDATPPADLAHPVYGSVGHLRHVKGVDVLLEASPLIRTQVPGAQGVVVGSGEDEMALRALRGRLGVEEFVDFLGFREDARQLLHALDVFVVPSRHEGLPVALLEAMALGRPVVATSVGGIREVVQDEENGLLVPPEDPGALADAVVRLLLEGELAGGLGAAARATVEERFSSARMAAEILEVYRLVIERRAR